MNKADLIAQVAARTGQAKATVAVSVEAAMATIIDTVAHAESVTLSGFGTFEPRQRQARTGRNPRTGDVVPIPPKTVPAFRPGNAFKNAVEDGNAKGAFDNLGDSVVSENPSDSPFSVRG